MSRLFYHTCQDNAGNLLFDVTGTMRVAGSGTLATIFGDEGLSVILPNPMTNHPSFASFKCFLGAGDYDFYLAKSGYTFETLTGVQGHGTMAQQDANGVNITGGSIQNVTLGVGGGITGANVLNVNGPSYLSGIIGVNRAPQNNNAIVVNVPKLTQYGLWLQAVNGDAGGSPLVAFANEAATVIGSISTTATATGFNTSSDVRLKHAVEALTGALDVVQRLRPVTGRWKADDSPLVGFLAHEVGEVVDGVVTGEKDAVDDEGRILPQQIDYSKLVPWLVSALQELAARVVSLETQLGV